MAGWSKRRKSGNVTTTINSDRGVTTTVSTGSKNNRLTYSHKPNGKLVMRNTVTTGMGTRVTTRTLNPSRRKRKRPVKSGPVSWIQLTIVFIILIIFWSYS